MLPAFREGSAEKADMKIQTAYARNHKTMFYDNSLLSVSEALLPADSKYKSLNTTVNDWKKNQLPQILLASDEMVFEQQYQIFLKGLKEAGIEELKQILDENYKRNCREYGSFIKKVNE